MARGRLVRMRMRDGRHGLRGCSGVGELVRMRMRSKRRRRGAVARGRLVRMRMQSKRRRRGAVARRVVGGRQPLGTNRSLRRTAAMVSEARLFGGRRAGPDAE